MTAADVERVLGEAGAVEHSAVDSCTSEHRDRDGQWHTCTEPGDHEDDHQNDYVGSWPWDDVDDPRQVRRRWVEVPLSMSDLAAVITPLLDQAREQVLVHARHVITQYVSTSELWRYERVCRAFAVMLGEIPEDAWEPHPDATDEELKASHDRCTAALNTKENDHG